MPSEFPFEVATVTIRRLGDAVILAPVKASCWPGEFFQDIWIDDPAFHRPEQGTMPLVQPLDKNGGV
jgi:virulence-associated protein VagC